MLNCVIITYNGKNMNYTKDLNKMYDYFATDKQIKRSILLLKSGTCEICKTSNLRRGKLAIEHNHKTGKFRGITCQSCNIKIGYVEKNKNWDNCDLKILDWITFRGH